MTTFARLYFSSAAFSMTMEELHSKMTRRIHYDASRMTRTGYVMPDISQIQLVQLRERERYNSDAFLGLLNTPFRSHTFSDRVLREFWAIWDLEGINFPGRRAKLQDNHRLYGKLSDAMKYDDMLDFLLREKQIKVRSTSSSGYPFFGARVPSWVRRVCDHFKSTN